MATHYSYPPPIKTLPVPLPISFAPLPVQLKKQTKERRNQRHEAPTYAKITPMSYKSMERQMSMLVPNPEELMAPDHEYW